LVSWRAGENGPYLIRNRSSGDSFQIGEEEHFLLAQLDGRQTSDEVCRAFQERFGQPLSEQDFDLFVQLAADRGLLHAGGPIPEAGTVSTTVGPLEHAQGTPGLRPFWKRAASRSLKFISTFLQWPARTLSAAAARLDLLRLRRFDFVSRPDDIFIVTYPRSGTTWMQMILYQLTSGGSMDFPHIAEYCPWFERSVRSARAFETRPSPRLFKSHLSYRKIPKGPCKYIYVARNGQDVAVSYYHLQRAYNGYEGTFEEFFDRFLRGKDSFGSWFAHVKGWWRHRHDPNVLFLTYEELTRDLEGTIRRIAAFILRDVSDENLPAILERCRFAFMKQYEQKFDPALETLWEQGVQLKSFLRNGRIGEGTVSLTQQQRGRFDKANRERLGDLQIPFDTPQVPPNTGPQP
jgi:hypothetical protein